MNKLTVLLLIAMFSLLGCSDTSNNLTNDPRDCNGIIAGIEMDYQSPTEVNSSSMVQALRAVDGESGYAQEKFDEMVGSSPALMLLEALKSYVGSSEILEGVRINLPANDNVSYNKNGDTFKIGASNILVKINGTVVDVYWKTNIQLFINPPDIMSDIQMQIRLEGGSSELLTDYEKITLWASIPSLGFKHKSWNDHNTSEYIRMEHPADSGAVIPLSGCITHVGHANDGIFFVDNGYTSDSSESLSAIFGDGTRIIFDDRSIDNQGNEEYHIIYYIIDDHEYQSDGSGGPAGASVSAIDKNFLDTGAAANIPYASWADATASGTPYYNLYGNNGTFDSEFKVLDQF